MDVMRFDALTRALAAPSTRRTTLGAVLASLLAPLGTFAAPTSDACIPTGQVCGKRRKRGGKKSRGKQWRRPPARPCAKCCSRHATTTNNKKKTRRCSCKPEGVRCGNRTQCCSGQCRRGACTSCVAGTTFCAGRCIDTKTDHDNCGACGHACAALETCQHGTCVADCDVCANGCDFASVQAAVDAVAHRGTIRICPGTYQEQVTIHRSLTLIGAGAGETILTGGGTATDTAVLLIESSRIVSIQALTVTDGNSSGNGGGIDNFGALTLAGVSVESNSGQFGAGIYNQEGFVTLERNSSVTVNAALVGGGIFNFGGTVIIDGSSVTVNTASGEGGGIYNDAFSSLTITGGSTVADNESTNDDGDGISNYRAEVTIEDSSVTGNQAAFNGGGIYTDGGTVTIDGDSSVTGNNSDPTNEDSGGGIYNQLGAVNLASADIVTGNLPDNCGGDAVPNCVG